MRVTVGLRKATLTIVVIVAFIALECGAYEKYHGTVGDEPVPADYDGDGATDLAVHRRSTGDWLISYSGGGSRTMNWQFTQDAILVPGDYDGDGSADIAVVRPYDMRWLIIRSSDWSSYAVQFGMPGNDEPVPADYDGDGKTDLAVHRRSTGDWFISYSGGGSRTMNWQFTQDAILVPADYDGDGSADIAVVRPSDMTWLIIRSSDWSSYAVQFGMPGNDEPVPADYDGDGTDEPAVFRESQGKFFIQGFGSVEWGDVDQSPVPGVYTNRTETGQDRLAVYRDGTWDIMPSDAAEPQLLRIENAPFDDDRYDWGGCVINDAGTYHMWWTRMGYATGVGFADTIWHATSSDGMTWDSGQKVLEVTSPQESSSHVARPSVVKVGSQFWMFYEAPQVNGLEHQIFLATSYDGTSWTKYPSSASPQPVISYNGPHRYGNGQPSVHYRNGQFVMYYVSNDSPSSWDTIRRATSADGVNWGGYTSHVAVAHGAGIDVKWNSVLDTHVMVYSTHVGHDTYHVYAFTSDDGISWHDQQQPPLLWEVLDSAQNLTLPKLGAHPHNRPSYPNLVATDQYGCIGSAAMQVTYTEGRMHPPGDYRAYADTWDLHLLGFQLGP